jgi:Flp pilus assembly protein TadD
MRFFVLFLFLFVLNAPSARADFADKPAPAGTPTAAQAVKDGWKQFYAGDLDAAEGSFKKAHALDDNSAEAEWGLGLVEGSRAKSAANTDMKKSEDDLRQSVAHLQAGHDRTPGNARLTADLAYSLTMLGTELSHEKAGDQGNFDKARALYTEAIAAAKGKPDPQVYENWAILEMYSGHMTEARDLWKRAKDLGASDPALEKALGGTK